MNIWRLLLYKTPSKLAEKVFQYIVRGGERKELVKEYLKKKRNIEIEDYTYGGCLQAGFNTGGKIHIGRYCSIANDVHYFGANHPIECVSTSAYFYNKKFGLDVKDVTRSSLIIANDVWIGYGALITMGCKSIGNGAVIGAGSIVTHDVPPYAIVAGNPAHIIGYRFTVEERKLLEETKWWELSPEEIMKGYEYFGDVLSFCSAIKDLKHE